MREYAPEPARGIRPGLEAGKIGPAQRKRHDVMAKETRQIVNRQAAAGASRQQKQAGDQQQRQRRRARPQPPGCDQRVKAAEQRRRLRVTALLEKTVEIEADGRQADKAEHQGRAQPAFEPIKRIVAEGLQQRRQAGIGKG